MLVPLSWLREYVEIGMPIAELTERITLAGLEVKAIEAVGDWWDPDLIRVGEVVEVLPHPNADRLVLVDVDFGDDQPQRVVTGAPNLFHFQNRNRSEGTLPVLKVGFARTGAVLTDGYSDERPRPKKMLKPSKIRGIESAGMVCSELELGISEEHEGILLLPEDAPVGVPLSEYLGDHVIELDLTPDMARCLSMTGVAREVSSLTGAMLHLPADSWEPSGTDHVSDYVDVEIADRDLCSRYTATLIEGVTVGESPQWIQARLRKAGMRPINNIVDITNYVMLEWGQPLHAFDYDLLQARAKQVGSDKPKITVRRAGANEVLVTLDDVKRTLDESMLVIADQAGAIAIAGVMGGMETEVHDKSQRILLESATFEGINNRRTAQKLRMSSEASYRFARGVPARMNEIAARRAAEMMRLYAGGRIVQGIADAYPVAQEETVVYATVSDVNRLLGMDVTTEDIQTALRRLDFVVEARDDPAPDASAESTFALHRLPNEQVLECRPPWHRLDVRIPADVTEEVARMIGYEQVGMTLMNAELPTQRLNIPWRTEENVRDILVRCGLQEIINITLTAPEEHDKLNGANVDHDAKPYVTLANPSVHERRVMRRSLLVGGLQNVARNLRYRDRIATFEVGRVYLPELGDGVLPREERRISIVLCGPRNNDLFYASDSQLEEMDFFDLKGVVESLLERLGFKPADIQVAARPDALLFGPRCAEITVGGKSIGLMGEVHPRVRQAFGVNANRVCVAEFQLDPLIKPHWSLEPMQPISIYPPVVEDLAFEVREDVPARRIREAIIAGGDELLVDVELFDIYRGDPLPDQHKSLAYRLTYQRADASMREDEVEALRTRIVSTVEIVTGGRLRST